MYLKAIAEPFQNLYREIPGDTHSDKATFLGRKASETIPYAAAGYLLRGRVSSTVMIQLMWCMQHIVAPLHDKDISQVVHLCGIEPKAQDFILQFSFSFTMGVKVKEAINSAKIFRNTSSWTDGFMFFCLAYSAALFTYGCFSSPVPKKEKTASTEKAFHFNLLLKCVFLPIQLKYRPKATLLGLGLSAIFAITGFFESPPPQAGKVAKIFREFSYIPLSVADPIYAIMSSLEQGKDLAYLFGYGKKTPPSPTETPLAEM